MASDPDLVSEAVARLGTTLCGKYRLDAVLGIGGMATVYATTHRNRAELAIKILHRDLAAQPVVRARFLREAYVANSVKHAGIVKIVDDDVAEDGSAFLVMQRLAGDVAEGIRVRSGGKLPVRAAVAIGEQLLDALAAAHAGGVVHRDVKPANLFVTTEGEVKVLDFGIARIREALATGLSVTGAATIMGTPMFMAPEQALPGSAEIDGRTDVWAAGATLFFLISGRSVHEATSVGNLVSAAAMNAARSLATVAPKAPRAIVEVVDLALAFEMSRRWASAAEMRAALLAAHRLHYGRSPARAMLAHFVGPPMSGIATRGGEISRTIPDSTSWDPRLAPRAGGVGHANALPFGEATVRSRTSMPVAAELARVAAPSGRGVGGWALSALAATTAVSVAAAAAVAVDWTSSRREPRSQASSASAAASDTAANAPVVPDASAPDAGALPAAERSP